MYCQKCGAEIKDETAKFCDRCGAELERTQDTYDSYNDDDDTQPGVEEDNLIWDDGSLEVPDNRKDNGERKKWIISIASTVAILGVTMLVLALLLGKNSKKDNSDIVVSITQVPKAEVSKNDTKTEKTERTDTEKGIDVKTQTVSSTPTPTATAEKKQVAVQPSENNTASVNTQTQQPAAQSEVDKDLEALQNVPTQEYVLPEENSADTSQSSSSAAVDTSAADSSEYIFPQSNSAYLTKDQLEGLSKDQMAYARNEIYARHGRRFRDQKFQDYFNSKSWYVPQYDPDQFDAIQDTVFNDYEKENARLILEVEKEHGYTY